MKVAEFEFHVRKSQWLTPTVFLLSFEEKTGEFSFQAGQFISVIIPGAGPEGRDLRRAYSIASSPEESYVQLCIKLVGQGPGTQFLKSLKAGDCFRAQAPFGNFLYQAKTNRRVCMIATGTGIAPFRSMILSQYFRSNPPIETDCLLGVRSEEEILYRKELSQLKGVRWIEAISQSQSNWTGFRGRVTDYLKEHAANYPWLETEFYLCGNGLMIKEIKTDLNARGVGRLSIHHEKYY